MLERLENTPPAPQLLGNEPEIALLDMFLHVPQLPCQ